MTRRLTPAERLAAADKDATLHAIVARTGDWDRFLVEQAVWHFGLANDTFSANDLRDVLPELAHGYLGAAINSLRTAGLIEHTGQMVPSTSGPTHGHRLSVWRLSLKGLLIAEARRPRKAAA
ncbi:hypothetical protein [Streptomyces noursei]|uniref:hypothetical protein n=1 Tax=Streptomyces noursei TaxID=1971 RepID=UPI00167943EE|nr:hypothetical protein [Streptomyces noursei]MCZ1014029.1 hypothetical protein [Streptomyces noursei]GGX49296.1 hypothetical protein GCM10010341_83690 [Streptomyces noursei]